MKTLYIVPMLYFAFAFLLSATEMSGYTTQTGENPLISGSNYSNMELSSEAKKIPYNTSSSGITQYIATIGFVKDVANTMVRMMTFRIVVDQAGGSAQSMFNGLLVMLNLGMVIAVFQFIRGAS